MRPFGESSEPVVALGGFGGDYFDPSSGRLFIVARPADQPELWASYIDGAWLSYRQHGVEGVVDYDRVRDGNTTALFIVAVEFDGRVVGGMRLLGPYSRVEQAYALREWAGREGTSALRRQIAERLSDGVCEIKAVWVDSSAARHDQLTAAMSRIFVHALSLMDVRYTFCTAASHAVPRWQSGGGVVSTDVAAVPYPDDRYRTLLMWWDRLTVFRSLTGEQARAIQYESQQLFRPTTRVLNSVAS